jgi:hypothetical protein
VRDVVYTNPSINIPFSEILGMYQNETKASAKSQWGVYFLVKTAKPFDFNGWSGCFCILQSYKTKSRAIPEAERPVHGHSKSLLHLGGPE